MKTCTVCKELKEKINFYRSKKAIDGLGYRCKACDIIARKNYRLRNRESALASQRRRNYKIKYGITVDRYNEILQIQNGCCAICRTSKSSGPHGSQRLAIDHCHDTGKVRGLLCNNCNRAVGLFKDDPIVLKSAIEYLDTH